VEDQFSGRKVAGLTLHDFCEEHWDFISPEDLGAFLLSDRDAQTAKAEEWRQAVSKKIRAWCEDRGSDEMAERERGLDEPPCRCRGDCAR